METTKAHRYGINADETPWKTLPMHTPGPWIFEESTETIRAMPQNFWIASMSWEKAVDRDANARLIAAAPDLLATAQRVTGISWSAGSLAFDSAIEQLRAAIAKATGNA